MKRTLNDKLIAALKPARKGARYDEWDAVVPGFGVRTTDTGSKSFIVVGRINGHKNPTRRKIGKVGVLPLAKAREEARRWLEQVASGNDPKIVAQEQARQAKQAEGDRFENLAELYIRKVLTKQINRDEIERIIRREFVEPWRGRLANSITTCEVADIVLAKADTAPGQARCMLNHVKQLFSWAAEVGRIPVSPAAINAKKLFGSLEQRTRVLNDAELTRLWHAASATPYPFGPIYQLLIMTGCRLNEVAQASRPEFDLRKKLWTVPASRMKGRLAHVIPLTPMMIAVIEKLPRWNEGGYLFSDDNGVTPVIVTDHVKTKIDKAARIYDWVNHDIRRTMRTRLSPLPIQYHVAELMIAHKQTGNSKVYNQFQYLDEKREGFTLWCDTLRAVVGSKPELYRAAS